MSILACKLASRKLASLPSPSPSSSSFIIYIFDLHQFFRSPFALEKLKAL